MRADTEHDVFAPDTGTTIQPNLSRGGTVARVLIADDAAIIRNVVREMLEQGGHVVVAEAGNGEEAIARYAETKPDLAIIDANMPVLDGFGAVAAIREHDPDARLIVASVHTTADRAERAAGHDAAFLHKPFEPTALLAAVDDALR
jgi:two-component system chemotaxis response regulator CheY